MLLYVTLRVVTGAFLISFEFKALELEKRRGPGEAVARNVI